jgi:MoaA/NifB/PqqE/SkfB family radical SAM enzyme
MVSILAYPKPLVEKTTDVVLTFVVPSNRGCDLNCSYCYIKQRKEPARNDGLLLPGDYAKFIGGISERRRIGCISVQGEEPLLPESMPYTEAILSISQRLNIPAALVTNGTHLAEAVDRLARYRILEELTVSLDASNPETHDRLRGKRGTFALVEAGLRNAMSRESLRGQVSVASVLFPGKVDRLLGIPGFLDGLEISQWFVTPALKIERGSFGGPVSTWEDLLRDLERLHDEASQWSTRMIVEDEFDWFRKQREVSPPQIPLRFRNLDHPTGVLRLLPNGTCEIGHELLRQHRTDLEHWIPSRQHPDEFYSSLMHRSQMQEGVHQ